MKKSLIVAMILMLFLSNVSLVMAQETSTEKGFWGKIMGFFSGLSAKLFGTSKEAPSSALNPVSTETKTVPAAVESTIESKNSNDGVDCSSNYCKGWRAYCEEQCTECDPYDCHPWTGCPDCVKRCECRSYGYCYTEC